MFKPDLEGIQYRELLRRFHAYLRPRTYLEIGTQAGLTLEIATCDTIAVDPDFRLHSGECVGNKPSCHLFQITSDAFFQSHRPDAIFGHPVELAFLDGMHRCEFLLRDFLNTERFCRRNSVILLHDCLPMDAPMASRIEGADPPSIPEREAWWTGDVWRTALALKRFRRDLVITSYDAHPTGIVAVTNLDPASPVLGERYYDIVAQMLSWPLDLDSSFAELNVEPTSVLDDEEKMHRRFWL